MPDALEFKRRQDDEVESLRKTFQKMSEEFVACVKADADTETQKAALMRLTACGRDYYRKCEEITTDRDGLSGQEFNIWLEDRITSAEAVLNGLITYHNQIRRDSNGCEVERCKAGESGSAAEQSPASQHDEGKRKRC